MEKYFKNVLIIVQWQVMTSQRKNIFMIQYEERYFNLSSSRDSQTQEDKLSLYLAMVMLINDNQKLLVSVFNVFCSWEQWEEGLKLGNGKNSFLAEIWT